MSLIIRRRSFMKNPVCEFCGSKIEARIEKYRSRLHDKETGLPIVLDAKELFCTNGECNHSWMPASEERRLHDTEGKLARHSLTAEQISTLRKALNLPTKTEAANF